MSFPQHATTQVHPLVEVLRQRRVDFGMSIRKASFQTGYHYNTIAAFETGKYEPSYKFLVDYAQLLGLEVRLCESSPLTKSI